MTKCGTEGPSISVTKCDTGMFLLTLIIAIVGVSAGPTVACCKHRLRRGRACRVADGRRAEPPRPRRAYSVEASLDYTAAAK